MSNVALNGHIHLDAPRPNGVVRAKIHTPYVVTSVRRGRQKMHVPTYSVSTFVDGRLILAARFACGAASSDVIPTERDDSYRPCYECVLAEAPEDIERFTVYGYLDADYDFLYIGQTGNLQARHKAHRRNAIWFPRVADLCVLSLHATRREALDAETAAIREHQPRFNVRHNEAIA